LACRRVGDRIKDRKSRRIVVVLATCRRIERDYRKQRLAFCTGNDIAEDIKGKTDRRIVMALMAIIAVIAITS
jgi:hypothetical protein